VKLVTDGEKWAIERRHWLLRIRQLVDLDHPYVWWFRRDGMSIKRCWGDERYVKALFRRLAE
jgi:hypothetical protein